VALETLWNEGGADIWSLRNSIGRIPKFNLEGALSVTAPAAASLRPSDRLHNVAGPFFGILPISRCLGHAFTYNFHSCT